MRATTWAMRRMVESCSSPASLSSASCAARPNAAAVLDMSLADGRDCAKRSEYQDGRVTHAIILFRQGGSRQGRRLLASQESLARQEEGNKKVRQNMQEPVEARCSGKNHSCERVVGGLKATSRKRLFKTQIPIQSKAICRVCRSLLGRSLSLSGQRQSARQSGPIRSCSR